MMIMVLSFIMLVEKLKNNPRNRVREELEKLPDGEVFTSKEIGEKLGVHRPTLQHMTEEFRDNVYHMGTVNYWGSKIAIKALKKQMSKGMK